MYENQQPSDQSIPWVLYHDRFKIFAVMQNVTEKFKSKGNIQIQHIKD